METTIEEIDLVVGYVSRTIDEITLENLHVSGALIRGSLELLSSVAPNLTSVLLDRLASVENDLILCERIRQENEVM